MEEQTIVVKKGSLSSFLVGALIGAGVALLIAPMSGRDTRHKITEKGTEIKDRAVVLANDTRSRAQETYETARTRFEDTVKTMRERNKDKESETVDELKRELEVTEDMTDRAFPL